MRKMYLISAITIAALFVLAPLSAGMATATTTSSTPALDWKCKTGDTAVVNNVLDFNITASAATWDSIDAYLNATLGYEVDAQAVFNDAMAAFPQNFGIQLGITGVSGKLESDLYSDFGNYTLETSRLDIINASIEARANSSAPFQDPFITMSEEFGTIATALAPILGASDPTGYAAEIAYGQSNLAEMAGNATNVIISEWASNMTSNATDSDTGPPGLPTAPTDAIPDGPFSLIVKPTQWDWAKEWAYVQAVYGWYYNLTQSMVASGYTTTTYIPPTLASVLAQLGISHIYTDSDAISFQLNLANVNQSLPYVDSLFENLNATGIETSLTGVLSAGLEYNPSTGILQRLGLWFTGSMNLNLTAAGVYGPLSAGPHAATSDVVPLTVTMGSTVTQDGLSPLTQNDIVNGNIGQAATGASIDAFPLAWVELIGMVSVIAIIIRKRMH